MVVNGISLLEAAPIKNMARTKEKDHGVSWGLSEVGYDIRIKQEIQFLPQEFNGRGTHSWFQDQENYGTGLGRFVLASAIEEFDVPNDIMGIVHDKSTWARQGLSVFNTVIEPGWKGFLTLELVYHGQNDLIIPAGSGIAQVVFHRITNQASYAGKYQNQANEPVGSVFT